MITKRLRRQFGLAFLSMAIVLNLQSATVLGAIPTLLSALSLEGSPPASTAVVVLLPDAFAGRANSSGWSFFPKPWQPSITAAFHLAQLDEIVASPAPSPERSVPAPDRQIPADSLASGRALYEAGRYTEAIHLWEQQLRQATIQGDNQSRALLLSRLALAHGQLGEWAKAESLIATSRDILATIGANDQNAAPALTKTLAQVLTIQGSLSLSQGLPSQSLEVFRQAEAIYQALGVTDQVIQSHLNQASALEVMGLYGQAKQLLKESTTRLESQPDSTLKAAGFLQMGNAFRLLRLLDESNMMLERSLAVAKRIQSDADQQRAILHLGNTSLAHRDYAAALAYYRQITCPQGPSNQGAVEAKSAALSMQTGQGPCVIKLQATFNQLRVLVASQQLVAAKSHIFATQTLLTTLPLSEFSVYAHIDVAETLIRYAVLVNRNNRPSLPPSRSNPTARQSISPSIRTQPLVSGASGPAELHLFPPLPTTEPVWAEASIRLLKDAARLFAQASIQAKTLGNPRADSYAQGRLAGVYYQLEQFTDAMQLARQALELAQGINAPELTYQWHWQIGRVWHALQKPEQAIAAYENAVQDLETTRGDLVATNPDAQFSFRDGIEPLYRELVSLLLPANKTVPTKDIKHARQLMESLQVAELQNFFRNACLDTTPQKIAIDLIDPAAAVIYPIILPDRLEVILSMTNDRLYRQTILVDRATVQATINKMYRSLRRNSFVQERLPPAMAIHQWLVGAFAEELKRSNIETLVFVLDGPLSSLPMAALHDGNHYLVEDYKLALTPGLQLLETQRLNRRTLKVLMAGVSEKTQGFDPLPGVKRELSQIATKLPSQTLINQQFTQDNFQQQIKATPFPVVHLATHGQFSSNPSDTFILAWDSKINLENLETILKTVEYRIDPIELLILSACQTAAGDDRASLGLAGVAVRSGARSTLATLWSVEDQSTAQFMVEFYQQLLQPNMTRAEALRLAQLNLLKGRYEHPYFWAPFVLVGNWQ